MEKTILHLKNYKLELKLKSSTWIDKFDFLCWYGFNSILSIDGIIIEGPEPILQFQIWPFLSVMNRLKTHLALLTVPLNMDYWQSSPAIINFLFSCSYCRSFSDARKPQILVD